MADLTAQMVEGGHGRARKEAAERRRLSKDIRAAREKLTSSTGLERTFEYELVRLFADYHSRASILLLGFAAAIAGVSGRWVPVALPLAWFLLIAVALGTTFLLSRAFLKADPERVSLPDWRRRFAASSLLYGLVWAAGLGVLARFETATNGVLLFTILMVAAATAMLSATIPIAVHLSVLPITGLIFTLVLIEPSIETVLLLSMTAAALLFFIFLARRLYGSAVAAITSRAEKDTMYVALEEAKANSDEARRRAEEANLAKSRFLATISHELRTPLNAILGFSEVMKNEVFGPHASSSYKEYSADIHGSGQHLLNLINEILDLSRIEAGRYELVEEAVKLPHIVEECRHMLALRSKAKNQTITERIDPTLPQLWADERAIRQIVLNVLSNAIKFTPPGGEILVKVGWTSSGGQYVSIKDTGPGIPEEEIPVVMSSFGRGSLAIKTAEQGSGLGLPIVKGLVDLHGGGFTLRSKPRDGTEVIVTFPAVRVMDALAAVEMEPGRSKAA